MTWSLSSSAAAALLAPSSPDIIVRKRNVHPLRRRRMLASSSCDAALLLVPARPAGGFCALLSCHRSDITKLFAVLDPRSRAKRPLARRLRLHLGHCLKNISAPQRKITKRWSQTRLETQRICRPLPPLSFWQGKPSHPAQTFSWISGDNQKNA